MPSELAEDPVLQDGPARGLHRNACTICRKRKMRCNRQLPCDTCVRLGFDCVYSSPRPPSGGSFARPPSGNHGQRAENGAASYAPNRPTSGSRPRANLKKAVHFPAPIPELVPEHLSKEAMAELEQMYFETIHKALPLLHVGRYMASISAEPRMRPPTYLRYIICALGALVSTKHEGVRHDLYQRARRELDETELNDANLTANTISRPQTWILIAIYEMLQLLFHTWWMSVARAVRVSQMMGLHVIDGRRRMRRSLPPARDWVEGEERRRAFWTSYCLDRYAAFGHFCPQIIDERDIRTLLPVPEEDFQRGVEVKTMTLNQALRTKDMSQLHPSAATIVLVTELGQKLRVLQQEDFEVSTHDNNTDSTDIMQKIKWLENVWTYAFSIPPHLNTSNYTHTPALNFLHMCAPTSTIILHLTAQQQASSHGITPSLLPDSQQLCLTAAGIIANTMIFAEHVGIHLLHPFTGACLYMAAKVLMRSLAVRPDPRQVELLKVLLDGMGQLQATNPRTGGYFKDLDTEFPGIRESVYAQLSPATQTQGRSDTESPAYRTPSAQPEQLKDLDTEFRGMRENVYAQFSQATHAQARSDTESPAYRTPSAQPEQHYPGDQMHHPQNGGMDGYGSAIQRGPYQFS